MTKYIVDIKGEIEGDYEIIGKYEERQKGKWIKLPRYEGDSQPDFKCENCGYEITYFSEDSFCARCGAEMEADNE